MRIPAPAVCRLRSAHPTEAGSCGAPAAQRCSLGQRRGEGAEEGGRGGGQRRGEVGGAEEGGGGRWEGQRNMYGRWKH